MPPVTQQPQQQPTPQPQNYDFIVNPQTEPPKQKFMANTSLPKKIIFFGGALIILFIVFSVAKSVLSGPSDVDKFVSVAQDQQQLISIATTVSQKTGLSTKSINSALTSQLGLSSDQSATLAYMANNGKKVKSKELNAGSSASINQQLTASVEAGTIDQTYQSVMLQELQSYLDNLQKVYKQTDGKKGHALLESNYKSGKLLVQQLQSE